MGSYFGIERFRNATVDFRPVITPHEYSSAFWQATRLLVGSEERPVTPPASGPTPLRSVFLRTLMGSVRRRPDDPAAHRRLGVALLEAGNTRAGARHLGIALRLLLADPAARESLHGTLCARLEIGLLLVPLIPIAARSRRPYLVRRLLQLLP